MPAKEGKTRATPLTMDSTGPEQSTSPEALQHPGGLATCFVPATTKPASGHHSLQPPQTREQEVSKQFCGTTVVLNSSLGFQIFSIYIGKLKAD